MKKPYDITPLPHSLVFSALPEPDYRDALAAEIPAGTYATITDFARSFFLAQPSWLRAISMNLLSQSKMQEAVTRTNFKPGDAIGSWKIYAENADEIVFGEALGFMTYRFSLSLKRGAPSDTIVASTIAKTNSRFGKVYFSLVKLVHKYFVRLTLRYALSAIRPTV